jgi:hypothetical protein
MAWTKATVTQITGLTQATWNTVTLSSFVTVPGDATGVILELLQTSSSSRTIGVRKTGDATAWHQESLTRHGWTEIVPLTSGQVDLYPELSANCLFYVVGFTGPETVFFARDSRPTVAHNSSGTTYVSRDVSASVSADATAVICSVGIGLRRWRPTGSSVDRSYSGNTANGHVPTIVKLDASKVFEIAVVASDFELIGYYEGGITDAFDSTITNTAGSGYQDSGLALADQKFAFGVTLDDSALAFHTRANGAAHAGSLLGTSYPRSFITALDANGELEATLETGHLGLKLDGYLYDAAADSSVAPLAAYYYSNR